MITYEDREDQRTAGGGDKEVSREPSSMPEARQIFVRTVAGGFGTPHTQVAGPTLATCGKKNMGNNSNAAAPVTLCSWQEGAVLSAGEPCTIRAQPLLLLLYPA